MKRIAAIAILCLITGCSSVSVDLSDFIHEKRNCLIDVVDERPDIRIFSTGGLTLEPSPPLRDLLHFYLCDNEKIRRNINQDKVLKVYITDVTLHFVNHFTYLEYIGDMKGYAKVKQSNDAKFKEFVVRSHKNLKASDLAARATYPKLLNELAKDFAIQIETTLYSFADQN